MMRDLWNVLPDDRPITSICIVEDPNKSPPGYNAVQRTYDQDTDADLWKEGFFGKKITRYLCHSKSAGEVNCVVDSMIVINDKDLPPEGFTSLTHTVDSEQKATKKRILCYRSLSRDKATQAITDIIVLSKSKKAPPGFTLAGDMNGHLICFKAIIVPKVSQSPVPIPNCTLSGGSSVRSTASHYSNSFTMDRVRMSPGRNATNASVVAASLPYPVTPMLPTGSPVPVPTPLYPVDQLQNVTMNSQSSRNYTLPRNLEYGRTWHYPNQYEKAPPSGPYLNPSSVRVTRPSSSGTGLLGIEGITFEINPKFKELQQLSNFVIPNLDQKTSGQIDLEYNYDFSLEYQTLQRLPSDNH